MSLYAGGFFEGTYHLEREIGTGSSSGSLRWLAYDFSSGQKTPVLIEVIPSGYDPNLHWHHTDVPGLRRVGQSLNAQCRYVVWEQEKAGETRQVLHSELLPSEKTALCRLIDTLPLTPYETILSVSTPEYWRLGNGLILFYRKQSSIHADPKESDGIRKFWKSLLGAEITAAPALLPDSVPEKEPVPAPLKKRRFRVTPAALLLTAVGLALAFAALRVKGLAPAPAPSTAPTAFNQALDKGIAEERKGESEKAIEYFKVAADMPYSEETKARTDSLAGVYEARAEADCQKYRQAHSPNLYFIPNQYYRYAAVLTETTPKKCE